MEKIKIFVNRWNLLIQNFFDFCLNKYDIYEQGGKYVNKYANTQI